MRGAMAAFSAGLGGADSVSVLPLTQALGLPDPFARRLARNAQFDPAGGIASRLRRRPGGGRRRLRGADGRLCATTAWGMFQGLEAQGGLYAALERGDFQRAVAEASRRASRDVARRKTPMTGVSDFPDLAEAQVETLEAAAPPFRY